MITGVSKPTKGTADLLDNTSVQRKIDELGTSQSEGAVLEFTVRHIGPCSGTVEVNESIDYSDAEDSEYKRGMKTMTIPAHNRESCRDAEVSCIKFVVPEDLDVSGSPNSICSTRNFKARFIAHYIDNDFDCCDLIL